MNLPTTHWHILSVLLAFSTNNVAFAALSHSDEQKYLGVYISSNRSDVRDMTRQLRAIYARGNMLLRKFSNCSTDVKMELFRSYCSNMYCSQLWCSFTIPYMKKLQVAYNNIFRFLHKVRGICSMSKFYVDNNIDAFPVIKRKAMTGFYKRILSSQNKLVLSVVNSLYFTTSSPLFSEWCKHIY